MVQLKSRSEIQIDERLNKYYEQYFENHYDKIENDVVPIEESDVSYGELKSHSGALSSLHAEIEKWAVDIKEKVENSGDSYISGILKRVGKIVHNRYINGVVSIASTAPEAFLALEVVNDVIKTTEWVKSQIVGFFDGFHEIVVGHKINPRVDGGTTLNIHVQSDSLKELVISEAKYYFKHKLNDAIDSNPLITAILQIIEGCMDMFEGKVI